MSLCVSVGPRNGGCGWIYLGLGQSNHPKHWPGPQPLTPGACPAGASFRGVPEGSEQKVPIVWRAPSGGNFGSPGSASLALDGPLRTRASLGGGPPFSPPNRAEPPSALAAPDTYTMVMARGHQGRSRGGARDRGDRAARARSSHSLFVGAPSTRITSRSTSAAVRPLRFQNPFPTLGPI